MLRFSNVFDIIYLALLYKLKKGLDYMVDCTVFKRILSSALVGLVLVCCLGATVFSEEEHWAVEALNFCEEANLIPSGFSEDADMFVTRAVTAYIISGALNVPIRDYHPFDDVPESMTYAPQISALYNVGIVAGTSATEFSPELFLTREELCTILVRGLKLPSAESTQFDDDADISDWAAAGIAALSKASIVNGYEDNTFRPQQHMTNAELATIVHKLYENDVLPLSKTRLASGSLLKGIKDGDTYEARYMAPVGLVQNTYGELIVVDRDANMVRVISTDGQVTTLAGIYKGVDSDQNLIGGYADGSSDKALLKMPSYTAVADNVVYFTDTVNNAVRKIDKSGMVSTVAGGSANKDLNAPTGIIVGQDGKLYIADTGSHNIKVIDSNGVISVFAGSQSGKTGNQNGSVSNALFCSPTGLAQGEDGAIYVADSGNSQIRKIHNGVVSLAAGAETEWDDVFILREGGYKNGNAEDALFNWPTDLKIYDGTLYVADTYNHCIRAIYKDGGVATVAGTGIAGNSIGAAEFISLNMPQGIEIIDGIMYIADTGNCCVKEISLR